MFITLISSGNEKESLMEVLEEHEGENNFTEIKTLKILLKFLL